MATSTAHEEERKPHFGSALVLWSLYDRLNGNTEKRRN